MDTNEKLNLPAFPIPIKKENGVQYLRDLFRKKWIVNTHEEWVRQNILHYLNQYLYYPLQNIVLEKKIVINSKTKRFDALITGKNASILMVMECKRPSVELTEETFLQIANYNTFLKAPFMLTTNGLSHIVCFINHKKKSIEYLEHIPDFTELTNLCKNLEQSNI